mgnify:CR=1 FL=1
MSTPANGILEAYEVAASFEDFAESLPLIPLDLVERMIVQFKEVDVAVEKLRVAAPGDETERRELELWAVTVRLRNLRVEFEEVLAETEPEA